MSKNHAQNLTLCTTSAAPSMVRATTNFPLGCWQSLLPDQLAFLLDSTLFSMQQPEWGYEKSDHVTLLSALPKLPISCAVKAKEPLAAQAKRLFAVSCHCPPSSPCPSPTGLPFGASKFALFLNHFSTVFMQTLACRGGSFPLILPSSYTAFFLFPSNMLKYTYSFLIGG